MRLLLLLAALAVSVASANAQDTNGNQHKVVRFDDGSSESFWKASFPSTGSDYFSVDMGSALDGKAVSAIYADSLESSGIAGAWRVLGVAENCAPGVPDPNLIAASANSPTVAANEPGDEDDYYSVACAALGSPANGYSAVVGWNNGDSHIWLGADTSSASAGRSFSTTASYAGCAALVSSFNWSLAVGLTGDAGELMINGGPVAAVDQDGGEACFTFYGPTVNTPGVLFLVSPVVLKLIAVTTDGAFAGPCPMSWSLCTTFTCSDPTFSGFTFGHFYFDFLNLKPNGKPSIQLATADLTVTASRSCVPSYGQKDDCIVDSTIWKVGNPAGVSDWFNVNHGTTAGVGVATLTGVEISSWDFCGFGPSWAEVGIYPANLAVDSAGCSPDVANPISTVGGSSAVMSPAAADWGCPITFYDTPDAGANSTTIYHVAAHWPTADSCIWLGSDTDGTDSGLGTPIPNNGCCSLFTIDGYSSPGVQFSPANWMMQIKWQ